MNVLFYVFCLLILGLAIATVIDELRDGWFLRITDDPDTFEVLELPVPAGWDETDVLTTYAQIQALPELVG